MKKNDKYIIRTEKAGVFYAGIKSRKNEGGVAEAVLTDARRIHYWTGATECIGISQNGVGEGSRVTVAIPEMTVTGFIEALPCTEKARKSLDRINPWTL